MSKGRRLRQATPKRAHRERVELSRKAQEKEQP